MKRIALVLFATVSMMANAQTLQEKQAPQINISGEGKVFATPDEAVITIGVENMGPDANDVKKKNDAAIDAVIKYLKGAKVPEKDYQTKRVSLNRNYDYDKKKYSFVASQQIVIHLKDLSKYDALMMGVVDAGANQVNGVEFRTSKQAQYESEARVLAVANAKKKAGDYAGALGQAIGKALLVTDNTQTYYPMPMMRAELKSIAGDAAMDTLAVGEIVVTANVNISFELK
ncbi:SIMPL domain-containing protein [uncultured Flavobacterium sp.]|uniref:SIMPL domain-containing protein n=1 Tax=uncultured Flavobacterium sp. TaxID=165435 RepID=UPI0025E3B6C8|nr:SIMPL domain-containing protein [uncultured Flavobacterium sp.]